MTQDEIAQLAQDKAGEIAKAVKEGQVGQPQGLLYWAFYHLANKVRDDAAKIADRFSSEVGVAIRSETVR